MGKESEIYMNPLEKDYTYYLKKNLEDKYIAYSANSDKQFIEYSIEEIKIARNTKSKLITVCEGRKEETKVKGYLYDFEIKGAPEIIKFAYNAGLGKLSSLGFGCIKPING